LYQYASYRKATEKQPKRKPKNKQVLLSQWFPLFFVFCFSVFSVIEKYIELLRFLPAKIVPMQKSCQLTDWSVDRGRFGKGIYIPEKPKNRKEIHEVLDFQWFGVFRYPFRCLFGGFSVPFRKPKTLDFQRFANIKQVFVFQCFYASLRCWAGGSMVGC
jgi:hypothetical protein